MKANRPAKPRPDVSNTQRREFLHKAAKVGVVTPAAVTIMLAAGSRRSNALLKYVCEYPCSASEPCSACDAYKVCED